MQPLFVVGDVHGHRDVLVRLLRDAGLVDDAERWSGEDAVLWLSATSSTAGRTGSARSTSCADWSARAAGAYAASSATTRRFSSPSTLLGDEETGFPGTTFTDVWLANGGDLGTCRR